jgi:hypothetical protein
MTSTSLLLKSDASLPHTNCDKLRSLHQRYKCSNFRVQVVLESRKCLAVRTCSRKPPSPADAANVTEHTSSLYLVCVAVSSLYVPSIHWSSLSIVRNVILCMLHQTTGKKATIAWKSKESLLLQIPKPVFPNSFPRRTPYLRKCLQAKKLVAGSAI